MAMATKEQERKALDKIRKIVAELGEDSYIATAFEGCFDDAEENIENDFAMSMNGRWQDAEQKVEQYRVKNEELARDLRELESRVYGLEEINSNLNKQVADFQKRLSDANKGYSGTLETALKYRKMLEEQEERANALEQEVITLKAKLYDLLCK